MTPQVVVLLSAGLHPPSGRPAPVPVELQAIRLATLLAPDPAGLHAGAPTPSLAEHLGHGLARILAVPGASADILPALAAATARLRSTSRHLIVLAGRRGQGGEDGGLLPYRLAHALQLPIVQDVVAAHTQPDGRLIATQWRPLGARREVTVAGAAVLTVHPAAPPPLPFVHAAARRGTIEPIEIAAASPPGEPEGELRPYRHRPPVTNAPVTNAPATSSAAPTTRRTITVATPEEAARLILDHLRACALLAPASPRTLAHASQDTPEPHRGGDRPA